MTKYLVITVIEENGEEWEAVFEDSVADFIVQLVERFSQSEEPKTPLRLVETSDETRK